MSKIDVLYLSDVSVIYFGLFHYKKVELLVLFLLNHKMGYIIY